MLWGINDVQDAVYTLNLAELAVHVVIILCELGREIKGIK